MSKNGYLNISKVRLPYSCIEVAYDHMRNAGKQKLEGVALFAGKRNDDIFDVKTTIIPLQKSMSLEEGLLYSVPGEELSRINSWLYENKMNLIAQIHSHPSRAYHSETDDAYPIIATVGGISIVVPNFGSGKIDIRTWAVYRLPPDGNWAELKDEEKSNLFEITN